MFSVAAMSYIKSTRSTSLRILFSQDIIEYTRSTIMKLLAFFAIFAVLAYVSANTLPPVYDGPTYELITIDNPGYDEAASNLPPIRHRRVTCDLLSWKSKWLTINHSACAAKCLSQRRRGGRCRDGICVCRN